MKLIDYIIDRYLKSKDTIVYPDTTNTFFTYGNVASIPPMWWPWDYLFFPLALLIKWLRSDKNATD